MINVLINSIRIFSYGMLGGIMYFVGKDFYEIVMKKRFILTPLNRVNLLINRGFFIGLIYGMLMYIIQL